MSARAGWSRWTPTLDPQFHGVRLVLDPVRPDCVHGAFRVDATDVEDVPLPLLRSLVIVAQRDGFAVASRPFLQVSVFDDDEVGGFAGREGGFTLTLADVISDAEGPFLIFASLGLQSSNIVTVHGSS